MNVCWQCCRLCGVRSIHFGVQQAVGWCVCSGGVDVCGCVLCMQLAVCSMLQVTRKQRRIACVGPKRCAPTFVSNCKQVAFQLFLCLLMHHCPHHHTSADTPMSVPCRCFCRLCLLPHLNCRVWVKSSGRCCGNWMRSAVSTV